MHSWGVEECCKNQENDCDRDRPDDQGGPYCWGAWDQTASADFIFGLGPGPHQYTIFKDIKGVSNSLPVVREFNHKFYLKPEVGGFMLGVFEGQPIPHVPGFVLDR